MKKTLVLGIMMISMVLSIQKVSAKDTFIYGENNNELMVSTLNEDGKTITPKLKYKYQYDDNGRMIERMAYKWNREVECWEPSYQLIINSNDNIAIIDYAEWSAETGLFTENQKQSIYYSDSVNHLVTYTNDFSRNEIMSGIY